MSKIICDICGTTYPETAEQCPICGSAKDASLSLTDELLEEEVEETGTRAKGGRFAASNVRKRGKVNPRYEEEDDEDEDEDDDEEDYYDDDDEEEEDEEHKSNAPLVVLLVIVIAALLAVTGFIFVKYFMPNMMPEETTVPVETTVEQTTAPAETTEPTIPCDSLVLTSGVDVSLTTEGENWLINVMALPEDTTDKLVYASSDESVVTVNEEGKLTAVGEGEAVITVTCGSQQIQCSVVCSFVEETTVPETTVPEETEPVETTQPLKDVELKVRKWSDLTFDGPNQAFTFELYDLANNEVKWTSQDESVVTVDENGYVLSVGRGQTVIICEYGSQKIEIPVNCRW